LAEVQASTHRVVIVHHGRIAADGSIEDLESTRGGARYNAILALPEKENAGKEAVLETIRKMQGVREARLRDGAAPKELAITILAEGDRDLRADIFHTAVEHKWVLLGLEHKQVDLESIFRRLTTENETAQSAEN
jgi:ABC-2 type transport system ATP-binding protein